MKELFQAYFHAEPEKKVTAAGRINIIGEHVDYCGGNVFPAALNLNCTVLGRKNGLNTIRFLADDLKELVVIDLDRLNSYRDLKWGNYQAGVAYELQQAGYPLVGCDLVYSCSVPFGSGLSSSAAIEVATAVMLNELAGNPYEKKNMALIAQRAENVYCGVSCGIMDQFASAMGKKDHGILLNCKTLDYEYVPLTLEHYVLVVTNSNKHHTLADGNYNERRAEVEVALTELQKVCPDITCLADLTLERFEEAKHVLSGKILNRAKHVVEECNRVKQAVAALKRNDIQELGTLLTQSHQSLSKLYEVTGTELDTLALLAWRQPGCLGSRMIGGGFGGCTISIVEENLVERFIREVGAAYEQAVGYPATFYETSIEDGVTVCDLT